MADPHHVPELDGFDVFTVRLYRLGLVVSAIGLLGAATASGFGYDDPALFTPVVAGAALSIADMHLYDKRIRWVIGAAGWLGVVLVVASRTLPDVAAHWVFHAGLGFVFVTLSGFALKEQFCFRIGFLKLVPLLLATSLLPLLARTPWIAAILLGTAGVLYAILAGAKLQMPLHFDIGDKSKYQI